MVLNRRLRLHETMDGGDRVVNLQPAYDNPGDCVDLVGDNSAKTFGYWLVNVVVDPALLRHNPSTADMVIPGI